MEALDRNFLSNDIITITFLICLVLVFFMKVYNPKYLLGYTTAFFTLGFMEQRTEKKASMFSVFYILILIFTAIIVTTTLFSIVPTLYFKKNVFVILSLFAGTLFYLVFKHFISYAFIISFNLKKELSYFFYTKNGYLYTTCLLLFPVLIVNEYILKNNFIVLLFIALLLIFRVFLIIVNNKNIIFNNIFYFILYFCTLELAPLLILYKTIN